MRTENDLYGVHTVESLKGKMVAAWYDWHVYNFSIIVE